MNLHVLPSGPIQTIGYLLTEPARGQAVLIDAPGEILSRIRPILEREGCRLTELWLTHGHWDHIQEAAAVVRESGAMVRGHVADRPMFETPEIMSRYLMPGILLEAVHVDHWMAQGDTFYALGELVEVRHVPGHCPGNILFHFPRLGVAFVGDALFNGSVGRTDLPGGSFERLEQSIKAQIYSLPDDTKVYPGHGPDTLVGDEKSSNPYVQGA